MLLIPLNDVLALVESLTLVDVDPLNDVLALVDLKDSYLMIHLMTLALVESLTLVDVDPLNDVLALAEVSTRTC